MKETVQQLMTQEWLETNGVGGWASSTVAGAHSRCYHGLLVAAVDPPADRRVLVSRLDETVCCEGQRIELATRHYGEVTTPAGVSHLASFTRDPFPRFVYRNEQFELEKTIAAIHGQNTIVVRYRLSHASCPVALILTPFLAGRDYHSVSAARPTGDAQFQFDSGRLSITGFPAAVPFSVTVPSSQFTSAGDWYYRFFYPIEAERGLNVREDLFTPGFFTTQLEPGADFAVVLSTETNSQHDGASMFREESARRAALVPKDLAEDPFASQLARAADQFLVQRGNGGRTIIAGYHWFTDWGRDTMIALPGLCLAPRRFGEARAILDEFSRHVSEGMLPNRFPDNGAEPEYNTIDATLWYFIAAYRYFEYTGDQEFIVQILLPVLETIAGCHLSGTRYGIHVGDDGLLYGGDPGTQLTWMDVKIGDWAVTPRHGACVEINALWFNALRILASFKKLAGSEAEAAVWMARADQTAAAFVSAFWNDSAGCLYDVLTPGGPSKEIRPNQLFALSLPFPLLKTDRALRVLQIIEQQLLTPRGLRTLSPNDPNYRGSYSGDSVARDSAYHQGTVWPWLLGPLCTALVRYRGEGGREDARRILAGVSPHLAEAGLGTISEIFDGDAPHAPRGCMAQAWSVAELLRAAVEDCGLISGTSTRPLAASLSTDLGRVSL